MSRSLHFFLLSSSPHTFVYHRIPESFRWASTSGGTCPVSCSKQSLHQFQTPLFRDLSSWARTLTGLLGPIFDSSFRGNFSLSSLSLLCFSLWMLSHPLWGACLSFSLTSCGYGQVAISYPQSHLFLQA